MKDSVLKKLIDKFKKGKCSEADLRLLHRLSESNEAIRRLLDFGHELLETRKMLSNKELMLAVRRLHVESRGNGRRGRLLGEE